MQRFPFAWLIELEKENSRLRRVPGASERRACHTLVQHRPTQRKVLQLFYHNIDFAIYRSQRNSLTASKKSETHSAPDFRDHLILGLFS